MIHGLSRDYPKIIHGFSFDYPWIIHELSIDYPWIIHGLPIDYPYIDYPCIDHPWIIHRISMDYPNTKNISTIYFHIWGPCPSWPPGCPSPTPLGFPHEARALASQPQLRHVPGLPNDLLRRSVGKTSRAAGLKDERVTGCWIIPRILSR